ncbi:MerR family transcriptional regulator [Gracilibacillus oryzae]|uniref:MerR family transcriptional regulator n=1 Tax=Gracilibacillus oryzae TaxID=1672701 RepID=A0A7C8GSS5_9BACI|nr:MerR family transcriptional regulator [Gracilibacillus oryzae]KAB8133579.1 MerR family transcriptional regulator [Gracilibacillus oryzae]
MENKEPKFTIGEFGKRAKISVRTLRFYEELGLLVPEQQNSAGHRLYGLAELMKLQKIQALKFIGYSLQEIKNIMENENETNALSQLEKYLPLQHKLLLEKRNELNRAIEAIERVQYIMKDGKPITWTVLSSLLFQIEHEEDQIEWVKEYFSDDIANQFFALPKEQRQQMDVEMLEWLAKVKDLMNRGVSPQSPEAFHLIIEVTEMATKHIDNKEELAEQLEKAQELLDPDMADFKFPTFLTVEEEAYLLEIGEAMEALYGEDEE